MAAEVTIAVLNIVLGLTVLIFPQFLRFIVGFYFIIIGLIGILLWLW